VSPSLACGRSADEPKRGGEVKEYQVEQIVRDVVNASRGAFSMILLPGPPMGSLISGRWPYK
jgi:hypothetical protein